MGGMFGGGGGGQQSGWGQPDYSQASAGPGFLGGATSTGKGGSYNAPNYPQGGQVFPSGASPMGTPDYSQAPGGQGFPGGTSPMTGKGGSYNAPNYQQMAGFAGPPEGVYPPAQYGNGSGGGLFWSGTTPGQASGAPPGFPGQPPGWSPSAPPSGFPGQPMPSGGTPSGMPDVLPQPAAPPPAAAPPAAPPINWGQLGATLDPNGVPIPVPATSPQGAPAINAAMAGLKTPPPAAGGPGIPTGAGATTYQRGLGPLQRGVGTTGTVEAYANPQTYRDFSNLTGDQKRAYMQANPTGLEALRNAMLRPSAESGYGVGASTWMGGGGPSPEDDARAKALRAQEQRAQALRNQALRDKRK